MHQYHSRVNLSWNFFVDLSSAPCSYAPETTGTNAPKSTVSGRVRGTLGAEPPLRSSGLANLVFCTWSNWFIRVKHLFIAKTMVGVLGLGSKLYPSNMPRVLSKDLTQCM